MSWETEEQILQIVKLNSSLLESTLLTEEQLVSLVEKINTQGILTSLSTLQSGQDNLAKEINEISLALNSQSEALSSFQLSLSNLTAAVSKILKVLVPPPAVTCIAIVTVDKLSQGAILMGKALKATGDLQVTDQGTFTVTLSFLDADGFATAEPAGLSASYTASDATPGPSSLTLTPSADTSSCAGAVNQTTVQALAAAGSPLPTGLTVAFTATWTGLASPVSGTAAPAVDLIAGPANSVIAAASTP